MSCFILSQDSRLVDRGMRWPLPNRLIILQLSYNLFRNGMRLWSILMVALQLGPVFAYSVSSQMDTTYHGGKRSNLPGCHPASPLVIASNTKLWSHVREMQTSTRSDFGA